MVCFSVAQVLGWAEQHRIVRELSGRPDVTIKANYDGNPEGSFIFVLQNANNHVAVNIGALDIVLPFPKRVIDDNEAIETASGIAFATPQRNEWVVRFELVDRLSGQLGDHEILNYDIDNAGMMQNRNLCYVLGTHATGPEANVPLTLVFSNLGDPKRTWHSHYFIRHEVGSKRLTLAHVGVGELVRGKTCCSHCKC
jgi:hypothetical protein